MNEVQQVETIRRKDIHQTFEKIHPCIAVTQLVWNRPARGNTHVENDVAEVSVFPHGVEGGEGVSLLLLVLDDEIVLRRNAVIVVRLQHFRGQFHLLHHCSLQLQSVHCQFCNSTSTHECQTNTDCENSVRQ